MRTTGLCLMISASRATLTRCLGCGFVSHTLSKTVRTWWQETRSRWRGERPVLCLPFMCGYFSDSERLHSLSFVMVGNCNKKFLLLNFCSCNGLNLGRSPGWHNSHMRAPRASFFCGSHCLPTPHPHLPTYIPNGRCQLLLGAPWPQWSWKFGHMTQSRLEFHPGAFLTLSLRALKHVLASQGPPWNIE